MSSRAARVSGAASLAAKVAIVTGASGGLGEAIARRLLEEGAQVLVSDLFAEDIAALVGRLTPLGEVVGHVADLSRPDFGPPLAEAAVRAFGGIDVVVNNAAIYPSKKWNGYTIEEFDLVIDTNLRSLFVMAMATVPSMISRGGGSIINIGSGAFLIGAPNLLPYVSSKGGLVGFTRGLARELGVYNIRVNNVSPGAFQTGGERIHPDPESYSRFVLEQQCLKRRGKPEELANVVAFVASDRASFITGQTIEVDGGWAHT